MERPTVRSWRSPPLTGHALLAWRDPCLLSFPPWCGVVHPYNPLIRQPPITISLSPALQLLLINVGVGEDPQTTGEMRWGWRVRRRCGPAGGQGGGGRQREWMRWMKCLGETRCGLGGLPPVVVTQFGRLAVGSSQRRPLYVVAWPDRKSANITVIPCVKAVTLHATTAAPPTTRLPISSAAPHNKLQVANTKCVSSLHCPNSK